MSAPTEKLNLTLASRRSTLARIQAETVGALLTAAHPTLTVAYRWIESEGDIKLDAKLADSGGKGLFAKAIERALLTSDADLAVHSLKDVPAAETPGLTIAAVPEREDVCDVLIAKAPIRTIADLPENATVGTASPRRAAQLKHLRPDIQIKLIRGNVQTRLRKVLDDNLYDATLLAAAGLIRLDLFGDWQDRVIDPDLILPAASQGALGLQCRTDDPSTRALLAPLDHLPTSTAVAAERHLVAGLHGDCHSPIAAFAEHLPDQSVRLRARVIKPDGSVMLQFDETAPNPDDLPALAARALDHLKSQGSDAILNPK